MVFLTEVISYKNIIMKLTNNLLALLSVYTLVFLPMVNCAVETITVGEDSETKKKNPYIKEFHDGASKRPTKCHGKPRKSYFSTESFYHYTTSQQIQH